jgi:CubicO group peptidase (beta-lactamase class C family)
MKITALFLALAAASAALPQERTSTPVPDQIAKFESSVVRQLQIGASPVVTLAERLKALKIPGLSVAIVEDFTIRWAKGYGVRDTATREPVTAETVFQAASIAKSISATITMRLVEEGRLDLDRNVNDYLKRWQVPENDLTRIEKVTLRRLLSHTAGLTVSGFRGYAEGEPVPTILQVLDGLPPANSAAVRVDLVPGTRYRYSGGGYTALQVLLEDVTGRTLDQLAEAYVFKPVGMTSSFICLCNAPDKAALAASGHRAAGAPFKGYTFLQGGSGCCELWTTPTDLARYLIALQKSLRGDAGSLLSRKSARLMATLEGEDGRSLGLTIRRYGETLYFGHDGGNIGFVSRFLGHPDKGYGLAVMINTDAAGPMIEELTLTAAEVYGWEGLKPRQYESVDACIDAIRRGRAASPRSPEYSEGALNRHGYDLIQSGETGLAIRMFLLNVELNPHSANACDSLAEGYGNAGDRAKAAESYRRALDLFDRFPGENASYAAAVPNTRAKIAKLAGKQSIP